MNDIEHNPNSPEDNQEDISTILFGDSTHSERFSNPLLDIIVAATQELCKAKEDDSPLLELAEHLHEPDRMTLFKFMEHTHHKRKAYVKIMKEYVVLVIEDGIRFFKEMKRLKRRPSTKPERNYYFSGVV